MALPGFNMNSDAGPSNTTSPPALELTREEFEEIFGQQDDMTRIPSPKGNYGWFSDDEKDEPPSSTTKHEASPPDSPKRAAKKPRVKKDPAVKLKQETEVSTINEMSSSTINELYDAWDSNGEHSAEHKQRVVAAIRGELFREGQERGTGGWLTWKTKLDKVEIPKAVWKFREASNDPEKILQSAIRTRDRMYNALYTMPLFEKMEQTVKLNEERYNIVRSFRAVVNDYGHQLYCKRIDGYTEDAVLNGTIERFVLVDDDYVFTKSKAKKPSANQGIAKDVAMDNKTYKMLADGAERLKQSVRSSSKTKAGDSPSNHPDAKLLIAMLEHFTRDSCKMGMSYAKKEALMQELKEDERYLHGGSSDTTSKAEAK